MSRDFPQLGEKAATVRLVQCEAVFTLIPLMLEEGPQNYVEQEMFELQELSRSGPLGGYWWDIIFAPYATDRAHKGALWEFLLTADGELQQATQVYSP
ncbi:hypothetical protein ACFLQ7_00645 [Actinomycetota bacterium]